MSADTLHIVVPGMLLQPLIENSIKHGLEPRLHGGTVTLRSRIQVDKMMVEVEDDGVGMADGRAREWLAQQGTGIGMRNVRERLEVLYGNGARFEVLSRPGRGTRVTLEIRGAQRTGAGGQTSSAIKDGVVVGSRRAE